MIASMMNWIAQRGTLLQKVFIGLLIALFFAAALYLRVALPYDTVFGGEIVKCTGIDAYWHMRIVDNLVHNFPHLNYFDPYMLYPGGSATNTRPFFDYLLAGIIWVVGLGSPSHHLVDVISVYFPAVLGALMVVPVYFIGKTLFNRWAGVVSAGLIAITPGDFLGRSILGFTDHHIAEALFSTTAMLFLILAVKSARKDPLTLAHFRHPNKMSLTRPIFYSVMAGIFLGIYLISWIGALLFLFIVTVYFIIQFVIDHLRGRSTDCLCLIGVTTLLTMLAISLSIVRDKMTIAALVVALLVPLALWCLSRLMLARDLRPIYYPLALAGLALVGIGLLCAVDYSLLRSMIGEMDIFAWPTGSTTMEMQPILIEDGTLSLSPLWHSYKFSLLFATVALGVLGYLLIKVSEGEKTLFVVWTLIIVAATLAQRRFNYYLAINIAVLAGYTAWLALRFAGLREGTVRPDTVAHVREKKARSRARKKSEGHRFRFSASHLYVTITAAAIFSLCYFPTIDTARGTAKAARFAPSDAWCESLLYLRDHTQEPFGDSLFYYARYETPFEYPESAYGVTSWWDYGYWIIRIGHRIPNVNPGQQSLIIPRVAELFLAQDETSAMAISEELGSRYVILDNLISVVFFDWRYTGYIRGKFSAIVSYTDHQDDNFYDIFYEQREGGSLKPVMLYFPEYYRSLCVRMYNFGGEAVSPNRCRVISYEEKRIEGKTFKVIVPDKDFTFTTYEQAVAYIDAQKSGNFRIVSDNPFVSPVPLEKLQHYRLVHDSRLTVGETPGLESYLQAFVYQYGGNTPAVRIFEYAK